MCGIVGYAGDKFVDSLLVAGLERLEYRGYDSAGIATLKEGRQRPYPNRQERKKKKFSYLSQKLFLQEKGKVQYL